VHGFVRRDHRRGPEPSSESIVGAYFGRLSELPDDATDPKYVARAFARQMGSKRFMAALETMAEMERLNRRTAI
jgi:hypothetical protein